MATSPTTLSKTRTAIQLKPAQYGRACSNCVKAKCRCLTRSGSSTCERCIRIKSDCVSSEITRKRATKTVVTSRLEEKVDGILSLLKSKSDLEEEGAITVPRKEILKELDFTLHGLDFRLGENNRYDGSLEMPAGASAALDANIRNFANVSFMGPVPSFTESTPPKKSSQRLHDPSIDNDSSATPSFTFDISPADAETYLNHFRTHLLPGFAFVHVSPQITAQTLQKTRPFLLLAIMMVSSPPASVSTQRRRLGQEIKDRVARQILSDEEGNLDVLLGLLVFLTWGHDQLLATHLVSRFTQIAISMLFDLRLNKPPPKETSSYSIFNLGAHDDGGQKERTMEERRATLGCWVLSSFISWYFVKIDGLRWTPYMDECLNSLSNSPETPQDTVFTAQIRLQLIAEKTAHFITSITKNGASELRDPKTALPFYIHALNSEMREIESGLSIEDRNNSMLQSYIHHTTISISALALFPNPSSVIINSSQGLTTQSSAYSSSAIPNSRINSLITCVASLRYFFTLYFSIPPSDYPNVAFPRFTHLAHAIVVLYHLTVLDEEGWDRRAVKDACDIEEVLRELVRIFGSLSRSSNLIASGNDESEKYRKGSFGSSDTEEGIDMPAKLAWIFEKAGLWVKGKLAMLETNPQGGVAANGTIDGNGNVVGGIPNCDSEMGQMDNLGLGLEYGGGGGEDLAMISDCDEAWLSEIFGPWNYDFM